MAETAGAAHRTARAVVLWLAALALAFALDGPVAHAVAPVAQFVKHSEVSHEIKEVGHFGFVLILAVFVLILHRSSWRGATVLCLSGCCAALFYTALKGVAGRTRPVVGIDPYRFEPFIYGLNGLVGSHNLAFPSGHACLAFATAACLGYLLPKGRWAFYAVAGVVAAQRVAELAHYLSDVVAGAALGVLAFHVTLRLCELADARLRALRGRGHARAGGAAAGFEHVHRNDARGA